MSKQNISKNMLKKHVIIDNLGNCMPNDIINIIYQYTNHNNILDNEDVHLVFPDITIKSNKYQIQWHNDIWFSIVDNKNKIYICKMVNDTIVLKYIELCNKLNETMNMCNEIHTDDHITIEYVNDTHVIYSIKNLYYIYAYHSDILVEYNISRTKGNYSYQDRCKIKLINIKYLNISDFRYEERYSRNIILLCTKKSWFYEGRVEIYDNNTTNCFSIDCEAHTFYKNNYVIYVKDDVLYGLDYSKKIINPKYIMDLLPHQIRSMTCDENKIFFNFLCDTCVANYSGNLCLCVGILTCDENLNILPNVNHNKTFIPYKINNLINVHILIEYNGKPCEFLFNGKYLYVVQDSHVQHMINLVNNKIILEKKDKIKICEFLSPTLRYGIYVNDNKQICLQY